MTKKIVIAVLLLLLIGAGAAFYLWNKPHPKPQNGIPVTSENLTREYNEDEKTANTKYLNKPLEVTGIVSSVTSNQDGNLVITLASGDPMAETQCTMADKDVKVAKGQNVTLVGFCKGNNMGVVLTDCFVK
jgi:hypothetical protein